jgi:GNAT superfamily N-acetyltransferase
LVITFKRLFDPRREEWRALMGVYAASFEEAQRETEDGLITNLTSPRRPKKGGHIVISAISVDEPCVGGVIFSYLSGVDSGYASYVFVAPHWRRRSIGTALLNEMRTHLNVEAMQQGRAPVRGLFTEIQQESGADTHSSSLLEFWERNGVYPLAATWEYPPLRTNDVPVSTYLAFGPYGDGPIVWQPKDLEHVAQAIFAATYAYLPAAGATLARIVNGLRSLPQTHPVKYLKHG